MNGTGVVRGAGKEEMGLWKWNLGLGKPYLGMEPVVSGSGSWGFCVQDPGNGKDGLKGEWNTMLIQCWFSVQCLFSNPASRGPCLPRRPYAREKFSALCSRQEMSHWIAVTRGHNGSTDLASTSSPRTWYKF